VNDREGAGAETATGTWHHGLVARWWAEFNTPRAHEIAYLRRAIARFGQPALDLGCGTGRLLVPLVEAGLDVDGVDVSVDMVAFARDAAARISRSPMLAVQATHELDLDRRYRTIFCIGTFGLGGDRTHDREALLRAHDHLEPGGALLLNYELPYAGVDDSAWARWLPRHRANLPEPWPPEGDRRVTADGDEIELIGRTLSLDPLGQRVSHALRARLWRAGKVVAQEERVLHENLYFTQEIVQLLRAAGFDLEVIEAGVTGVPAGADDAELMFVARRV
jgi:SAM-dependent methyltransferase